MVRYGALNPAVQREKQLIDLGLPFGVFEFMKNRKGLLVAAVCKEFVKEGQDFSIYQSYRKSDDFADLTMVAQTTGKQVQEKWHTLQARKLLEAALKTNGEETTDPQRDGRAAAAGE